MTPHMIAMVAVALLGIGAIALYLAGGAQRPTRSLREALTKDDAGPTLTAPAVARGDAAPALSSLLRRLQIADRAQWTLLRAGVMLKPSEGAAIMLALSGLGFAVGLALTHSLPLALALAAGGLFAPWAYVGYKRRQRVGQLEGQLAEALDLISSGLRSGYSFLRACRVVVDEMPRPISDELRWLLDEVNVGLSLEVALERLARRTESRDVRLVVTAVQIQTAVGGNLAEILEGTADVIRERIKLRQELKTLTAEGRISAVVLCGLPIAMGFVVRAMSPEYMSPLFTHPLGHKMLLGGALMMLLGVGVIRQMLRMDA